LLLALLAHVTTEIEVYDAQFRTSDKRGAIPRSGQNATGAQTETTVKLWRNVLAPQVLLSPPTFQGRGGLRHLKATTLSRFSYSWIRRT